MNNLLNKLNADDKELIEDFKILIGIGVGMFLFLLFFQPFDLEHIDFNNKILLITGFAGIIFFFLCLFYIVLPRLLPVIFKSSEWESRPDYLVIIFICAFTSVGFSFYLRYVGSVHLSIFIVFKIVLICLFPSIALRHICLIKTLKHQNQTLINKNREFLNSAKEVPGDKPPDKIEIYSENNTEKIELKSGDLLTIKSADNYIEIYYLENNHVKKQLIRSSLKNVDELLKRYNYFQRCHRTSIVNIKYAEKLVRNLNGYSIVLKNFDQEVPVSRQYILKVKDALNIE